MSGGLVGGIFSAVGDAVNNMYGRWSNERDFGYQKDLNNNQISWRVADAQRAGIHPLYALGPTGATFSPVSTNFAQSSGQDLSRAEMANRDRKQRENEFAVETARLQRSGQLEAMRTKAEINRLNSEAELNRSQIVRNNSAQLGPGGPGPSAQNGVMTVPDRVTAANPLNPSQSAGTITDWGYVRTNRGWAVVPSQDVHDRIEDTPMEWSWAIRNGLVPGMSRNPGAITPHPRIPIPYGNHWEYFPGEMEWRIVPNRRSRRPSAPLRQQPQWGRGRMY